MEKEQCKTGEAQDLDMQIALFMAAKTIDIPLHAITRIMNAPRLVFLRRLRELKWVERMKYPADLKGARF